MGSPDAAGSASPGTSRRRLVVNATELARQPGTQRHVGATVSLADLDVVDPRVSGDVDVEVTATSTLDDIEITGTLRVAWADQCARCLRPIERPLVVDVAERYAEPRQDPSSDVRTDPRGLAGPDDPEAFPILNGQIDLAPMVREEVLLHIPDAPRCRDDCAGLCPVCGADQREGRCGCDTTVRDERWAALDALRAEMVHESDSSDESDESDGGS